MTEKRPNVPEMQGMLNESKVLERLSWRFNGQLEAEAERDGQVGGSCFKAKACLIQGLHRQTSGQREGH